MTPPGLDPARHDRDAAGETLVYPVVSRRAGGLSIGINLNPDRTCNWACGYCEVVGLTRGRPAPVDPGELERQLDGVIARARAGEFGAHPIRDLCIAGDGEPTLSAVFDDAVRVALDARSRAGLADEARLVVITNGSRVREARSGLEALGRGGGEIWLKLDGGTREARETMNGVATSDDACVTAMVQASGAARTELHTMVLRRDGRPVPGVDGPELTALVARGLAEGARIERGVVYGLARPAVQPGAERLSPASPGELERVAGRIRAAGLDVVVA